MRIQLLTIALGLSLSGGAIIQRDRQLMAAQPARAAHRASIYAWRCDRPYAPASYAPASLQAHYLDRERCSLSQSLRTYLLNSATKGFEGDKKFQADLEQQYEDLDPGLLLIEEEVLAR